MGLRLKLIYQRVCKIFIGKENKPDLDGKIQYFSVQRTGDQLVGIKIRNSKIENSCDFLKRGCSISAKNGIK